MGKLREIEETLARGKVIPAIKRLRELTGWGLKDTKEAVDFYRQRNVWPSRVLELLDEPENEPSTTAAGPSVVDERFAKAEESCARGKKILAIKHLREATGLGLKETKEAVEHFMRHGNWNHPAISSAQPVPSPTASEADPVVASALESIEAHCANKQKIKAIKELRAAAGLGLKDAKAAVDHFFAHGNWSHPAVSDWLSALQSQSNAEPPSSPTTEPVTSSPTAKRASKPATKSIDERFAGALKALEDHLGKRVEARLAISAEHMIRTGALIFTADRACFVYDEYGRWRVNPEINYSEVSDVEVIQVLGAELHVKVGYHRERFSKLDDKDAEAALAIFRVYAG